MRKIPRSEYSSAHKKLPEWRGQIADSHQERTLWLGSNRTFPHEQPERGNGDEARQQSPEKNFVVVMPRFLQQPKSRERTGNRSYRVHQSLESESAPICIRRNIRREQRFLCRRPNATAEPRERPANQHVIRVRCKCKRSSPNCRNSVSKYRKRLATLQPVGVVASGKFRETREPVGNTLNQTEPRRSRPNRRKESGQNRRGCFMTPIAK